MNIKVSACMITYNHERFIKQAVESVLMQQTDFDFEIVVGEDCSTDSTRQILLDLQAKYPEKIRLLLREENIGAHRNAADTLGVCQAEYVVFLDGDDYWINDKKVQKQVEFLDSHPDYSMCGHRFRSVYENATESAKTVDSPIEKEIRTIEDFVGLDTVLHSTVMARRCMIPEYPKWFYSVPSGDMVLQLLCAERGRVGFINEVMTAYRQHNSSIFQCKDLEEKEKSIMVMFDAFKLYFGDRYRSRMRRSIAEFYYWLSHEYKKQGNHSQAGICTKKAKEHNPSMWLPLRETKRRMKRYFPLVYSCIKGVKHAMRGSHL